MKRRDLLTTAAAIGAAAIAPVRLMAQGPAAPAPAPAAAMPGDARLTQVFDAVIADITRKSPEFATSLGLDSGANAALKRRLDDNGPNALADGLRDARRYKAMIEAVDPATLSPQRRVDREVVLYNVNDAIVGPARFGLAAPQRPYRISQQNGAYFGLPDFLNSAHTITTADDAEAYLARLALVASRIDNDTAIQRSEARRGRLAPGFLIDLTLGQLATLRRPAAADSTMTASIVRRTAARNLAGNWGPRAAAIVERQIYPALDRQIAMLTDLRRTARSEAGLGAIPDGAAIYAAALASSTTTTMTPDEVHAMGLANVAELSAQLDTILRAQGMTNGTLAERLNALNTQPAQLYANTDAGRAELIAGLNAGNAAMQAKLALAFNNPPNAPLDIRRVPAEIQDGAPNGYYNLAALDGSRPAIYWINLKNVGDWPKLSLPSLTYHEGVPGHHLQISTALRAPAHLLRKISFFGAYLEGWALYAEQLADELGGYNGPIERAGYLQSFLFRSARLVVDTGINAKGWSRERATRYFIDTVGFAEGRSQREIDRYCASPGQACSYKIGHASWLRARARAQQILGDRFDLRAFHDILEAGALPLTLLERFVEERAQAAARG